MTCFCCLKEFHPFLDKLLKLWKQTFDWHCTRHLVYRMNCGQQWRIKGQQQTVVANCVQRSTLRNVSCKYV